MRSLMFVLLLLTFLVGGIVGGVTANHYIQQRIDISVQRGKLATTDGGMYYLIPMPEYAQYDQLSRDVTQLNRKLNRRAK
jgi:cell division protein FtsB